MVKAWATLPHMLAHEGQWRAKITSVGTLMSEVGLRKVDAFTIGLSVVVRVAKRVCHRHREF